MYGNEFEMCGDDSDDWTGNDKKAVVADRTPTPFWLVVAVGVIAIASFFAFARLFQDAQ